MKKLIKIVIVLLMTITMVSISSVHATTYGDYEYKVLDDGTIEIIKYNGKGSDIEIPSTINGKKVTAIGDLIFDSSGGISSVKIPKSITSIEDSAFSNYEYTEYFKLIVFLDSYALDYACEKNIDYTLAFKDFEYEYIGFNGEFVNIISYRGNDANVVIPSFIDGKPVEMIDEWAFFDCDNLISVKIPESVKYIEARAFSNCHNLISINLPEGLEKIDDCAFCGLTSLKSIIIPKSVKYIGWYAFGNYDDGEVLENLTIKVYYDSYGMHYVDKVYKYEIIDLINVNKVSLNKTNASIYKNKTLTLKATITPSNATDKTLKWTSSNPKIATVSSNGVVKGISAGTATITVKTSNGKTATCKITVKNPTLSLNYTSKTLNKGSSFTLKGTATPSATVTYKSSNTKIATVSSTGVVKGVNGGKATITATANGISKTCTVTVPYTIAYKLNSGTNSKNNPSSYYGKTIKLSNPTRKGYTFQGWYSDSKYKTKVTSFSSGNKTLYAKWTATKYGIKYNMNKGTNSKSNPTSYYITSNTITLKNPTRKGYIFSGWYSDSKFKTRVTKIAKGSTGNKNLYAKWSKVSVAKAKTPALTNTSGKKLKITYSATTGAKGYQIQYATNSKFSKATTKTVSGRSATYTLSKGKTYYVRVRAYKNDSTGSKVYGSWSSVKSKKITK